MGSGEEMDTGIEQRAAAANHPWDQGVAYCCLRGKVVVRVGTANNNGRGRRDKTGKGEQEGNREFYRHYWYFWN